ncbi:EAL domain-containing protein [Alkanindiges sp. WGS2144]|uniref:sensor domain-containing protein n=1 Tax=Alkanindiges sp. WGS2144 TaxID=3366808 RepID=UPI003751ABB9
MMAQRSEQNLYERIFNMQIIETQQHQNLQLLGMVGLLILTYLFYYDSALISYQHLASWCMISTVLIVLSTILNNQLASKNFKSKHLYIDIYLQINAFVFGLIIAIGQILMGLQLTHSSGFDPLAPNFYVFDTIVVFSHLLGLISLTIRIRCFYLLVLTSMSPILAIQLTNWPTFLLNDPFFLINDIYILFVLFCGFHLYKTRERLTWLVIRNDNLVEHAEHQRSITEQAYQQLEQEMLERRAVEQKLQQANQRLEEKVKERTFDIQQINLSLERSKQSLEMAHQTAGIGSWDWDIKNRSILTTNFDQILGYSNEEINDYIGNISRLIHPEDFPGVKRAIAEHLRNHTSRYESVYRIRHKQGYWVWVQDMGRVIQRHPKTARPLRMVGIRRNINDEKIVAERLKLSASVFERAAEGIFILDSKLHYLDVNPCFEQIMGLPRQHFIGTHVFHYHRQPEKIQKQHAEILKKLMQTGEFEGEIIEKGAHGQELPLWIHINSIRNDKGSITHYIGILSDLTQRKQAEQRLSYLSNYDTLTDLPNRNLFKTQLHQLMMNNRDKKEKFALFRLNIDRFRFLNDSLQNDGGDILLQQVARRLRLINVDALMVARLGGDDFAIIFESFRFRGADVKSQCKKIMQAFEQPFVVNDQELIITVSMGIALFPEHGRQVDSLSNHAEKALQEAKRLGGSTVRYYTKDEQLPASNRVHLENALRKALINDEFVVYYQPKICVKTRGICGFEALVRWQHPEHGLVPPVQFIPLAEETSLISNIGEVVLRKTCQQIKEWEAQGFSNIKVSVNVVAQQIQRGHLIDEIDEVMATYQINPRSLELEITESSLMDNSQAASDVLQQLKARNISIALDDFGTGYSSLSYLGHYPIDVLKIDRSFISNIGTHRHQEAIVRAILAMGHSLNMQVVAEGVETCEHAHFLTQEGCDILQGYLISKPLNSTDATAFLQDSPPLDKFMSCTVPQANP